MPQVHLQRPFEKLKALQVVPYLQAARWLMSTHVVGQIGRAEGSANEHISSCLQTFG